MKRLFAHSWIVEITAALLILLFAYTGISKLNERNLFQFVISKSPLVGNWSALLSWTLPILELVTALLLFIPATKQTGLWISLVLMMIFSIYIGYMVLFSKHLPCSCGGVLKQLTWTQHLVFNILFAILSALCIWLYKRNQRFIAINRSSRTPA